MYNDTVNVLCSKQNNCTLGNDDQQRIQGECYPMHMLNNGYTILSGLVRGYLFVETLCITLSLNNSLIFYHSENTKKTKPISN